MTIKLINLRSLKQSLLDNGFFIELFTFRYKSKNFLVFFRLLNDKEKNYQNINTNLDTF